MRIPHYSKSWLVGVLVLIAVVAVACGGAAAPPTAAPTAAISKNAARESTF